jgi:hypothetical protein
MEKIFITGTGCSGTTFLIKLFSFLDYDTGFDRNNYKKYIYENCNSGMELYQFCDKHYIIKSPLIMENIESIIKNERIKIKYIVIPIRDYKISALSRVSHSTNPGGLWNATNEQSQIEFYNKIISNYLYVMTKYDINTIFLDFDKMVTDKKYLFNKLVNILSEKNISFELFSSVYDEVSLISKPKTIQQ